MSSTTPSFRPQVPVILVAAIFVLTLGTVALAQSRDGNQVKVKVTKIVDGDTAIIEKTMDESQVSDFTKQFQNIKGKNVQVMIAVENRDTGKKNKDKTASSMHFNFDMDSSDAKSFARIFMFPDSGFLKKMELNDSLFKNLPKNFNFNFDFNDEGALKDFDFDINTDKKGNVVIKNGNGKSIVIEEDEDAPAKSDRKSKDQSKTKTIIIKDEKNDKKKKIVVSTSVVVVDLDETDAKSDKKSGNKAPSEGSPKGEDFSFYPNPSDGNFMLEMNMNEKEDAQVKITDINGKEIYNEKLSGNGKTIKPINLDGKKGTFIVTIKQGRKTSSKKIIIE